MKKMKKKQKERKESSPITIANGLVHSNLVTICMLYNQISASSLEDI